MIANIAWKEGLALLPHHFQRSDEVANQLRHQLGAIPPSRGYGFLELSIDEAQLVSGQIALRRCRGIFPGGIAFDSLELATSRLLRTLPANLGVELESVQVFLGMPAPMEGAPGLSSTTHTPYIEVERNHPDASTGASPSPIGYAVPNIALRFSTEQNDGYLLLPIGTITRGSQGLLVLNSASWPTALDARINPFLTEQLQSLTGEIRRRLADLERQNPSNDASGLRLWLEILHLRNHLPVIEHLLSLDGIHPEEIHRSLTALAGGLCFTKGLEEYRTAYRHDAQATTLGGLLAWIRQALAASAQSNHLVRKLNSDGNTMHGITVDLAQWASGKRFWLAVTSTRAPDELIVAFGQQAKISPRTKLQAIILSALQGIEARMSQAPAFYRTNGQVCFELVSSGHLWNVLLEDGGLGVYCPPALGVTSVELLIQGD